MDLLLAYIHQINIAKMTTSKKTVKKRDHSKFSNLIVAYVLLTLLILIITL